MESLVRALRRRDLRPVPVGGMDILHLAFEDHLRPGSGGGGVRTHEINRRLSDRHRITVVTTRYRGARRRIEDGVLYRPLGLPLGYYGSVISYHLCVPFLVLWTRADLVVEDFAAPMSSVLVPLWTRRPTVAVVQWLFAAETSRRYRLPFHVLEKWGVRLHRRFVAASGYMADELAALSPGVQVDVVYAGVDRDDGHGLPMPPTVARQANTVLYLGRLQEGAKGLDLLLEALAQLAQGNAQIHLVVAGDGPYRRDAQLLVDKLDLADQVTFLGWVRGEAKWNQLRRASVVVVPSRFESFGLVVLESFAAGTPVVAFDLPSMRELVRKDCGILVPAFDVVALADAVATLLANPPEVERMGAAAQARAAGFSWDDAARAQERSYLAAVKERHRPK